LRLKNLYIEGVHGAYYIPTVEFNSETGICKISGESYLEDTGSFYAPLLEWIETYFKKIKSALVVIFDLEYYNTSSSKCIVDMLALLKKYKDMGNNITVNWYYKSDSEDYEEEIEEVEDFMIETGIDINLIKK